MTGLGAARAAFRKGFGANIMFCDGHARWVKQGSYLYSFSHGTDEYEDPLIP